MPLKNIFWNGLYDAQPEQRAFAEIRIRLHYDRMDFGRLGIETADVRYVYYTFHLYFFIKILIARPTSWHGESGQACGGGHLMVDFCLANGDHSRTHHVYTTDRAYASK